MTEDQEKQLIETGAHLAILSKSIRESMLGGHEAINTYDLYDLEDRDMIYSAYVIARARYRRLLAETMGEDIKFADLTAKMEQEIHHLLMEGQPLANNEELT